MAEWIYDQGEVVVTLILSVCALIFTGFRLAYKIGGKITELDQHTTAGLKAASTAIDHVSEKVDHIDGKICVLQQENREQHDTILEHGLKIDHLADVCPSMPAPTPTEKPAPRKRRPKK